MKITDTLRRSSRSLRSAKLRTFLTAMAIAVGAFTLTLTLAASNGLRHYTDQLIQNNFDPAELMVGRDREVSNTGAPKTEPQEFDESVTALQTGPGAGFQIKQVTEADIASLKTKPYAEQVRENYQISIRYVTREGQKRYTGGVEQYNPAQKPELAAGTLSGRDIADGQVLLPESYLEELGFKSAEDALGKQITISVAKPFSEASLNALFSQLQSGASLQSLAEQSKPDEKLFTYTVAAVTKKPSLASFSFGVLPLRLSAADSRALYDYTSQGTNNYGKFMFVSLRVKDGEDETKLEAAKQDLLKDGFFVTSTKDVQQAITQFVDILTIMVGVFGLITVIASVFGIVNTQYISVLERTREIGLMKALGLSRSEISQLFVFESTWIGFLGGVLGSLAGFLLGSAMNPAISKQINFGAGNNLLIFKPVQFVVLVLFLMVVATVAGLLPARKAAKLDPIEALRTE